jgi:3-oxoadipate enol-lactonase
MPFYESRGAKLHFETLGTGPAVLLIHGFTNHGLVWAEQLAPLLSAGYGPVLVDLAGHGLSEPAAQKQTVRGLAEDMVALLDQLEIERAAVCGLSLGGMVGQFLAADFPNRIGPLVLANTCVDCTAPEIVAEIETWIDLFQQPGGPVKRLEAVWPKMLNEKFRISPTAAAFKASWMRIVESIPGTSFGNVARALQTFKSTNRLALVRTPCLVISSEFDGLFPPPMCKVVADLIAGASFTVIPGGSHLSSLDSPKEFNDLLVGFLAGNTW